MIESAATSFAGQYRKVFVGGHHANSWQIVFSGLSVLSGHRAKNRFRVRYSRKEGDVNVASSNVRVVLFCCRFRETIVMRRYLLY